MRQLHEADEQKILLSWLKAQGAVVRRPLLSLHLITLVNFVLQLLLFWYVSLSVQILLIEASLLPSILIVTLAVIVLCFLGATAWRIRQVAVLENTLYAHLQQQFFQRLSQGQIALVRQHSTYYWQQIWLSQLPLVGQYNGQYLVQQRLVMLATPIVLLCVFPLNWLIALAMLLSLPVIPLFMIIIGKGAANLHRKHFKAIERMGSIFVDRIKALELLRLFNAHQAQAQVLDIASEGLNKRTMQVVGVAFLSSSVLDFFSTLAVALVAVFVGFNLLGELTLGGKLSLHTGLFILLVAPLCFAELKQLGRLYHLRAEAIAAASELQPLLNPATDKTATITDANTFSQIHWQEVSLKQPDIYAASIKIDKGDWIYLQGDSGSGKTCFLEGLMGQRNSSHHLHHAVLIAQHAVILPTSIRDNLSLGNQYADSSLYNALKQVELDSWLAQQADGLDTVLDEHIPLSGGQQQRLALARVFLADANIVLLDEPTAHLTQDQHQRLSQTIRHTLSGKTVIWASHKALPSEWFTQQWQMQAGILTT